MLEKLKAGLFFETFLKRRDIRKAYKMVGPEDSWYDTITTVHNSLARIQEVPHQDWELNSFDGLKLKAVYYPADSDKTMIWVHGFTSHAERESAFPALFYRSLGFNVLIPYLRTHGPSEGKYITFGALEYRDIMDWVEKVNGLHPKGSILIHGLSMGGGIALELATKEMDNVKCLVADAPVSGLPELFRSIISSVFKKDAQKVLACFTEKFRHKFHAEISDFDFVENCKNARYPLLLSAGSNEQLDGLLEQIKENSPMETTVLVLPGCNHGNGMYKQTELYQKTIADFIAKNM